VNKLGFYSVLRGDIVTFSIFSCSFFDDVSGAFAVLAPQANKGCLSLSVPTIDPSKRDPFLSAV
jgi:hypothetical protein